MRLPIALAAMTLASIGTFSVTARGARPPSTAQRQYAVRVASVRRFLRAFVRAQSPPLGWERGTTYNVALARLGPGPELDAVVYIQGRFWCGSGGCPMLVLAPRGRSGWSLVSQTTIVWTPIAVLPSRSHGWRDLAVWVEGGGILPGYMALVPFDGHAYAPNPTVPPARKITHPHPLRTLIPADARPRQLFPANQSANPH